LLLFSGKKVDERELVWVQAMPTKKHLYRLSQPGTYHLILACGWTFVIVVSLLVSILAHQQEIIAIGRNVARAYIEKDILFRNWNALHGGIYVPVTKETPPHPFYLFSSASERDVITPSGHRLTFVNPAEMTRQIYELSEKKHNISARITSLKPLRPENKPDAWERMALGAFERGEREVSGLVTEDHTTYMRLMRPFITDDSCLTCHAHKGYRTGEILGGIDIKLPMMLFESAMRKQTRLIWGGHAVMWLLGIAGLYAGNLGLKRRTEERDEAEKELRRVNLILESQATTDSLTAICNRRKFLELLQIEMQQAKRSEAPLALIFFDIDNFKAINDIFGHDAGDSVLQEIAGLVTSMIRETDIFARFGGEEFVILLLDCDVRTGLDLAEKIRLVVERQTLPKVGSVTCSFGVARLLPDDTPESLIKRADDAMYRAKQGGKNRVETT
jgi:diguanylate cyclase (GGDEF)-like protein